MKMLNVVEISLPVIWEDMEANLDRLDRILEEIFSPSFPVCPDILVLPEFFSTGNTANPSMAEYAEDSRTLKWMFEVASERNCAVAGSIPILDRDGRMFNRLYFVKPDGNTAEYDKRHLYFGGEENAYTAGNRRVFAEFRGWRIMFGICFDMRFPIWSRNERNNPADLYVNVANWPASRRNAAEVLAAARAIENVCYVAFCNRTGKDPDLEYADSSVIFNHRGRKKSRSVTVGDVPVVYASLDREELERFRRSFPILTKMD